MAILAGDCPWVRPGCGPRRLPQAESIAEAYGEVSEDKNIPEPPATGCDPPSHGVRVGASPKNAAHGEPSFGFETPRQPHEFRELCDALVRCYPRLRKLIGATLRRHHAGHPDQLTNPPTALTTELVLRLMSQRQRFNDDDHVLAVAGELAVRVILDDQKRRNRVKRGAGKRGVSISDDAAEIAASPDGCPNGDVESGAIHDAVRDALSRLIEAHPRAGEIASLTLLFELSQQQIADATGVSVPTVQRDWRFARAWLGNELEAHKHEA
jgi:RNA polymerase sigma factor (TIGR02999 family)